MRISNHNMLVALADDDGDDRLFFEKAFEEIKMSNELILFENGKELLDFLNDPDTPQPNIIFLDLNMPIMGGFETLKNIRSHPRLEGIIIAIYSTSSSKKDIEDTFVLGANIYITKPNSFSKLKETIQKIMATCWQYDTSSLNRKNFLLRI